MRHNLNGNGISLEEDLRNRIRPLAQKYREEVQQSLPISRLDLLTYVQASDNHLARKKRNLLERATDAVCNELEKETIDMTNIETDMMDLETEELTSRQKAQQINARG